MSRGGNFFSFALLLYRISSQNSSNFSSQYSSKDFSFESGPCSSRKPIQHGYKKAFVSHKPSVCGEWPHSWALPTIISHSRDMTFPSSRPSVCMHLWCLSLTKKVHCAAHDWGQLTCLILRMQMFVLFLTIHVVSFLVSNQDGASLLPSHFMRKKYLQ